MNKFRIKVSFVMVLTLVLCMLTNSFTFAEPPTLAVKNSVYKLEIQKKYNPLRNQENSNLNKTDIKEKDNTTEKVDFKDEKVEIQSVTYYDVNGNVTREYKGEEAMNHLIEEEQKAIKSNVENISDSNTTNYLATAAYPTFEGRVIESYVTSQGSSRVIRKDPINVDAGSMAGYAFNVGVNFLDPVFGIVHSAITGLLPTNLSYKANDIVQNEVYTYFQKVVELRSIADPAGGSWFSPLRAELRKVDLSAYYYVVDNNGKVTKFFSDWGKVEESYYKNYYSNSLLITDAKLLWDQVPYYHVKTWNYYQDPYNVSVITLYPKPYTVIR